MDLWKAHGYRGDNEDDLDPARDFDNAIDVANTEDLRNLFLLCHNHHHDQEGGHKLGFVRVCTTQS